MKSASFVFLLLAVWVVGCSSQRTDVAALLNVKGTLPAGLPFDPLGDRIIASTLNRRNSTIGILFGNESAVIAARTGSAYAPGAVLSLVTWHQRPDDHWFGGRIPGAPKSVEVVTAQVATDGGPPFTYRRYEGDPIAEITVEPHLNRSRTESIVRIRAAVLP